MHVNCLSTGSDACSDKAIHIWNYAKPTKVRPYTESCLCIPIIKIKNSNAIQNTQVILVNKF